MVFFTLKNKAYSNLIHAGGVGEDSNLLKCMVRRLNAREKFMDEEMSASMYPSIRAKMLSRTKLSRPLLGATLGVRA
jgi:hypothetical protein